MTDKPLLILDFDGVIIDGMNEYWSSSQQACINLLSNDLSSNQLELTNKIPENFKELRPWVEHGWEMVLIAAEALRDNSYLRLEGANAFSSNYRQNCKEALAHWGWEAEVLQKALDSARKDAISSDFSIWVKQHQPFPDMISRLKLFSCEGIELCVLTTKSTIFTKKLLDALKIKIKIIFGYEFGSKANVLSDLGKNRQIKGFIEDRRETLEKIAQIPSLKSISCYLASWGYLKPTDKMLLPNNIILLDKKKFAAPLATWN